MVVVDDVDGFFTRTSARSLLLLWLLWLLFHTTPHRDFLFLGRRCPLLDCTTTSTPDEDGNKDGPEETIENRNERQMLWTPVAVAAAVAALLLSLFFLRSDTTTTSTGSSRNKTAIITGRQRMK